MKYYCFCATLDSRTSVQCRAKDGKIFPVDDAHAGVNLPPLHPHCRSTVVASLKADSKARGERVARNDDGSIVHIPANGTYKDWKDGLIRDTKPAHISVIDAMSNSYRPKLGNPTKVEINKNVSIPVNRVLNSRFDMVAEEGLTRRSMVIRLAEKLLRGIVDVGKISRENIPLICVADLGKYFSMPNAAGSYSKDKKILFLNSKYDTVGKLEAFLKKNSSYFSNTELDSVIMHELGHKYYYDAIETLEKKKNISYNKVREFLNEKIAEEISKLRITEGFDIEKNISVYANKDSKNHNFSELVAEIHASTKINSYSKRLMRFIEEVIRNDVITH